MPLNSIKLVPDRERAKTYDAEWAWELANAKHNIRFLNQKDAERWALKNVYYKPWFIRGVNNQMFCHKPPRVIFKEFEKESEDTEVIGMYYGQGLVALCPKRGNNLFTLTHELAHYMGYDLHDEPFRKAHLEIIKKTCAESVYKSLKMWYSSYIKSKEKQYA